MFRRHGKNAWREPPSNVTAVKPRIVQLQEQINSLSTMKDAIASFVESLQQQKEQERASLLDSLSPFLSLGPVNLSKVLDFLDAKSMFNAKQASYTLSQIMLDYCLWDRLDTAAIVPSSHDNIPEAYQTRPCRSNGTARFWKESKHETDLAHQSRHTGAMISTGERRIITTTIQKIRHALSFAFREEISVILVQTTTYMVKGYPFWWCPPLLH
jgi:hypothetical protein